MEEDGIRDGQSDTREDEGEDDDASLADGDELGNGDDNAGDGDDGDGDDDGDALPHCGATKKHGFGTPARGGNLASCGLRSPWRDGPAEFSRGARQRVGPQPITPSANVRAIHAFSKVARRIQGRVSRHGVNTL